MLSCTFRYGRQDMDVMGVAFRRDLFLVTRQVYPELQDKEKLTHTKIQQKLLRKLGDNAFPFFFEVRNSAIFPKLIQNRPGILISNYLFLLLLGEPTEAGMIPPDCTALTGCGLKEACVCVSVSRQPPVFCCSAAWTIGCRKGTSAARDMHRRRVFICCCMDTECLYVRT